MPERIEHPTHTNIHVDVQAQIRQLWQALRRGGFDPNEDPVIIGASSTGGGGSTPTNVAGGYTGGVAIGRSAFLGSGATRPIAIGNNAHSTGAEGVALGYNANVSADEGVALGPGAKVQDLNGVAIGLQADVAVGARNGIAIGIFSSASAIDGIAIGDTSAASGASGVAIGNGATALHVESTAIGYTAVTTKNNQIMLGAATSFVEIPGNSGTAPNGLVLTDTATGTRYIVQITSGALVLSAAP